MASYSRGKECFNSGEFMDELQAILADHRPRFRESHHDPKGTGQTPVASVSEIPDIFFDDILVKFRLSRIEIVVLMYIYRRVWCWPNLHKAYGISPLLSYQQMSKDMGITPEENQAALLKLQEFGLIQIMRAGQYFVRQYFTKELDDYYQKNYDDFEV